MAQSGALAAEPGLESRKTDAEHTLARFRNAFQPDTATLGGPTGACICTGRNGVSYPIFRQKMLETLFKKVLAKATTVPGATPEQKDDGKEKQNGQAKL